MTDVRCPEMETDRPVEVVGSCCSSRCSRSSLQLGTGCTARHWPGGRSVRSWRWLVGGRARRVM